MRRPQHVRIVGGTVPDIVRHVRHDDADIGGRRAVTRRLEVTAKVEDMFLLAAERREIVLAEDADLHASPTRTKAKPRRFSSRMIAGSAVSIGCTSGCGSSPRPSCS